uniref:Protein O-mannosyltransferase 1 n=1 Tax=Lepeophtheirus salmonis TaxID=72036 RepID=A0A0K2V1T9_LEPSM
MRLESESSSLRRRKNPKNNTNNNDEDEEIINSLNQGIPSSRLKGDNETNTDLNSNGVHSKSKPENKEESSTKVKNESFNPPPSSDNPFTFSISVDIMALLLFILSIWTRCIHLDQPRNVVFDEMHYGKYATMYLKRTFFFDSNPPLGKMMIAGAALTSGYEGNFTFDKIGTPYPSDFPLMSFRMVPALCGSTLSPLVYLILCQMGLSHWSGFLAGFMVLFDTALLTQSRYILLESIMMMFSLISVLSALKFRTNKALSLPWFFWFFSTVIGMSLSFCVKYLGIYCIFLCVWIMFRGFWSRIADQSISNLRLVFEALFQLIVVNLIPMFIYLGLFYVHLSILTKAGSHDNLMTSAFQASLDGGLSSIIRGQPSVVAHGSQITLRHTHGKTCWLHSHEHVYPVKYSDNRGSSHQQQVSCYGYKDVNNWWIVKRPDRDDLAVHEPLDVVKDGDVIQLVHGLTHRALNSHDVAAPMSPHNQEVSCYIDYNISMHTENLWKVNIANPPAAGEKLWYSIGSQVRLIHHTTGQALKYSGKLYPDWGFHQNEVVADKNIIQLDTTWNVEEHRYTKNDDDQKSLERELITSELIPTNPTDMSFFEKFIELQIKMLITDQENVQNHNYASGPQEWPVLSRGIAYFISKSSNAQVHLLGNIIVWYSGTLSIFCFFALYMGYLLRRRRKCFDISEGMWLQFLYAVEILFVGYVLHFIPFFFYDRTMFLHHYLTSYLFKIMLTSFLINHIYLLIGSFLPFKVFKVSYILLITLWCCGIVYVFLQMSVLSYGIYPMTAHEVKELKWKETWDLIIHKP